MSDRIEIGDCVLRRGNCLEVLPSIGAVDHCITDPPYEAEAHTLQRRQGKGYGVQNRIIDFDAMSPKLREAVSDAVSERCSGWFLAFCQAEAVGVWRGAMEASGAAWRRSCVWIKPDGMPQFTGDRPGMGYESIAAAWCGEGKSVWNGGGRHGVYEARTARNEYRWGHETQKPIKLMEQLIADFTQPGDTVLDPFMGSGTTGVACAHLGRKFIGIEIEPAYFDIAAERIRLAYAQGRLFA